MQASRAHSPSFQSLHLRHSSFSNPSLASPTSQLILQPFPRFTYFTAHFPTLSLLHLRHSSFSNPSFASPTSEDFHLRHLARRPRRQLILILQHAFSHLPHCIDLVFSNPLYSWSGFIATQKSDKIHEKSLAEGEIYKSLKKNNMGFFISHVTYITVFKKVFLMRTCLRKEQVSSEIWSEDTWRNEGMSYRKAR